jgi:MYXO-CTERM domain-containing protein
LRTGARLKTQLPFAAASLACLLGASGCAQPEGDVGCSEVDAHERATTTAVPLVPSGEGSDEVGAARSALSLESLAGSGGCSTAGGEAISRQLIAEMLCLAEGRLVRFDHPNVTLTSSRVHPYLSPEGRDALYRAAESGEIRINSGLRTLSDQYLLYAGCSVAATPGRSNHETGRAIDVDNWSARLTALTRAGFTHPLPDTDAVHFESAGDDLRSLSVLSFQRLWNANHPEDVIAADGITGPQTLARLARTPAEGFATSIVCMPPAPPTDAGMPPVDAGTPDAGTPEIDAGVPDADAGPPEGDAGAVADAGTPTDTRPRADDVSGCACAVPGTTPSRAGWRFTGLAFALALFAAARVRRRSRRGAH